MPLKGVALTVQYVAWDTANNVGKTGDAANHTLKLIQDGTVAAPTNSPSEVDASNCPGVYKLALTAAEMNYGVITLAGKSSTSGVVIVPVTLTTEGGDLETIKGKTNNLPASPAATGDAMTLTSAYDAAKTASQAGDQMDLVDAPNATAISAFVSAIWGAATRTLTGFGTLASDVATAVWGAAARTLTGFGTLVSDIWANTTRSLTDKAGFSISGTKTTLDALNDLSADDIQTAVTTALNNYDPPTKAEMDAAFAALNNVSVGDLLAGDISDSLSFPADSLADRLRKLFWILCNRMIITDASGAFTAYKGDGTTPGATGTIVDNGTNTVRSAPAWP